LGVMALWSEEPKHLQDVPEFMNAWKGPPNFFLALQAAYAEQVLGSLRAGSPKALSSFDSAIGRLPVPDTFAQTKRCIAPIVKARVAIHVKDRKNAVRIFLEAEQYLNSLAPAIALPVHFAAMHHRNALALKGAGDALDKARARALKFFRKHVKAGYLLFEPLLEHSAV
ncbi:MAG: hypothetical protein L6Q71_03345, partial [Planctomycetes bacterium]|nr:hypothetical protein [Planctomycetota bacterium]